MQRIASLTFDRKKRTLPVCDFRVAAVTAKSDLEVPVHVNQDERELLLAKTLENPQVWNETEFPYEEEVAGMKKEMLSMKNFDVFDEVPTSSLSEEAFSEAISTLLGQGEEERRHCAVPHSRPRIHPAGG